MLMKKIRFSLPIILGIISILNLMQFLIGFDPHFFSSFLLFGLSALVFYFIIKYTTNDDGTEKS